MPYSNNSKNLFLIKTLRLIEQSGNRLPHPTVLFIWLCCLVLLISWLLSLLGVQASHPVSGEAFSVVNLLSVQGINQILGNAVNNFTSFAPVGVVLVMMLGIGVAEHSGLIAELIQRIMRVTSNAILAYVVAFTGVMSSIGADVGYVVLIPLAGILYQSFGRSALAGIAVAFAGVSAGFSANLFIGPVDVMLASISTEAASIIAADSTVQASDNYYFIVVSTLLITFVCGWLSNHIVEPHVSHLTLKSEQQDDLQATDSTNTQSLKPIAVFSALYIIALAALSIYSQGQLQLLKNIVPLLALYFGLSGYIFGRSTGKYASASQAIEGMQESMATMANYIVLMFFAAQFVSFFSWSNIGIITAINGANWLGSLELSATSLLPMVVLVAALINLLIGSASAKWALMAPVFIPMLMLLGIPPEQTQIAYRVGDSATNIITPLMPYFGIVLAYAQRYKQDLGMGDIISMMLPYSIILLLVWSAMVAVWIGMDIPLGPSIP